MYLHRFAHWPRETPHKYEEEPQTQRLVALYCAPLLTELRPYLNEAVFNQQKYRPVGRHNVDAHSFMMWKNVMLKIRGTFRGSTLAYSPRKTAHPRTSVYEHRKLSLLRPRLQMLERSSACCVQQVLSWWAGKHLDVVLCKPSSAVRASLLNAILMQEIALDERDPGQFRDGARTQAV